MTIEEAIKYFEERTEDNYYVPKHREASRLAIIALKAQLELSQLKVGICSECQHYLPYQMCGRVLPEGKCTKYQINVKKSDVCKAKRWESVLPRDHKEG